MNTSFKKLSRHNVERDLNNKITSENKEVSKVQVNIVGDWSKKKGPSVKFSVQPAVPKREILEQGKQDSQDKISDGRRKLKSFNLYLTEEDNVKSVNEYNDELPDKIEGTYKYDFNILDIHDLILRRFEKQKDQEVKKLEEQLRFEENKMNISQNMVERKTSIRKVAKLRETLDNILSGKDLNDYINRAKSLIEQYNKIGTLSKVVSFATNKKKSDSEEDEEDILPEDIDTQKKRHQVIFDFLEIARKYVQIDLIRDLKEGNICESCGHKLEDIDDDEDIGVIVCSNCRLEKIAVVRYRFYKDNTRTNNSGNNYEDRGNFEKILMRFQGKQVDKPPIELYEILEKYFQEKELLKLDIYNNGIFTSVSSEYIRENILLDADGEKTGTSRTLMYKALKDTENSQYYDHINLILHEMWGWELPDIAHLEDQIMDDYDKSQRVYEELPKDRKSSLNSQFRLFKHLRRLGYPCKSRNFRIPTTHDILEFHENIWSRICEILDWENL